jgi:hypothetical protein
MSGGVAMKRLYSITLTLGLAMSLASIGSPSSLSASTSWANSPQQQLTSNAAQQMPDPSQQGTQFVLAGKILLRHGHYVFYNTDTHSVFRVMNPTKVKPYKGDTVKVQGKVNAQRRTIFITKINSIV